MRAQQRVRIMSFTSIDKAHAVPSGGAYLPHASAASNRQLRPELCCALPLAVGGAWALHREPPSAREVGFSVPAGVMHVVHINQVRVVSVAAYSTVTACQRNTVTAAQ